MMLDVTPDFSKARHAAPNRLHFAAHSHHLWPDVSFEAQKQAWEEAASFADGKWERVFEAVIPEAQSHIARILGLADPSTIAFAPNTHELLMRVVSCLPYGKPASVLTTDSEFLSARRQFDRLEEEGWTITRIPTEPFESFEMRFQQAVAQGGHDLIYFSQVFYNSGYVVADLESMVSPAEDGAIIMVDGYHAFMALPTDFQTIQHRAFYLAGGYKYAMAGESVCFMHCPSGWGERPVDTGWYAGFSTLEGLAAGVPYATDGLRFMGSTFDPSGLHRFNAVQRWLQEASISVDDIHHHVSVLQAYFCDYLEQQQLMDGVSFECLMPMASRGHFLTFRTDKASTIYDLCKAHEVLVDYRDDRLRIGIGIYHQKHDVDTLFDRVGGGG